MRLPRVVVVVLCLLAGMAGAHAASPQKSSHSRDLGLSIRVEGGGWGAVGREQIETVLYAVADELLSRLPAKLAAPIVVTHTNGNPIALYDRGPGGEYRIRLHASDTRWHLYVYEFAHEFCHVMSNYEEHVGADTNKHNQWFEETLCETASLFTLRSLAATWEAAPPTPEWGLRAGDLRRFYELLVGEEHRQLPSEASLAAWLGDNEERLQRDPYQRKDNEMVASLLLPLFERSRHWDALCYLNLDPADVRGNLQQYLRHWHDNAPLQHKAFIAGVRDLLRVGHVAPVASAPAPAPAPADGAAGVLRPAGQRTP